MKIQYGLLLFAGCLIFQLHTHDIQKELDGFHAQSYHLDSDVRTKIEQAQDRQKVLEKMKNLFNGLGQNEQELFIEIMNQMADVPDNDPNPMLALVDRIEKIIQLLRKKDGFVETLMSSSKKMLSSFQRNLSGEVQLPELFAAILHGDRDALNDLSHIDFTLLRSLSLAKKVKIMQGLQLLVKNMLDQINVDVSNQITRFHNAKLDDDAYDAHVRELGLQHIAYSLATIKYCKDVVRALNPICTDSQALLLTMDNIQIDPVLNIVDLKDFVLDPKESVQQQQERAAHKAAKLQDQGLLFVPKHKDTQELFYKQLRDKLVLFYGKLYARRVAEEVRIMRVAALSNQGALDTVLASYNNFDDLAPDLKQVVSDNFDKELASLRKF